MTFQTRYNRDNKLSPSAEPAWEADHIFCDSFLPQYFYNSPCHKEHELCYFAWNLTQEVSDFICGEKNISHFLQIWEFGFWLV